MYEIRKQVVIPLINLVVQQSKEVALNRKYRKFKKTIISCKDWTHLLMCCPLENIGEKFIHYIFSYRYMFYCFHCFAEFFNSKSYSCFQLDLFSLDLIAWGLDWMHQLMQMFQILPLSVRQHDLTKIGKCFLS